MHLPLTPDGWFKTGDVGALKDGCLSVTGRKDNMFISGGENIHPEEIEKVILTLEGVSQVVVIPKEYAEFGARPVAFIQYAARTTLTPEHITAHCQNFLPKFKIPVAFYAWPQELKDGYKVSRHNVAKLL